MRIRTLVPALACLAAAPIYAADSAPAVKFDGFADSYVSVTNNEHGNGSSGFGYAGKLGVAATISDKVSAQVDLNIDADSSGTNDNKVSTRQVYGTWNVTDAVALKSGKFISDYGWTAAYSPGLYRINSGIITTLYGVDQVGVNAKYTAGALSAALTVANGFFAEDNGSSSQTPAATQDAYAFGLDVVYTLGEMGSVNLELISDADAGGTKADGTHIGLNATLTPVKELTVGAELIVQNLNKKSATKDTAKIGATLLANYKLATATPMSVTGQVSYLDIDQDPGTASDEVKTEYAVSLLTNPAGTDKLGANLELSYTSVETNSKGTEGAIGMAAELLYVF